MRIDKQLEHLQIRLPEPSGAGGNYLPSRRVGNLLFLAGVVSADATGVLTGTVGKDRSLKEGYAAARACALTQLAVIRATLGSLDAVRSIISVNGFVNVVPGFAHIPQVINGASDVLVEIFGEAGRHVRASVGVSALPRNALVEVQMIAEL